MRIVICGAGDVGRYLAAMFEMENHDITVMDIEEDKLERLRESLEVNTVVGNATVLSDLMAAEVHKADLLVAVTKNETDNMVSCSLASGLGAKKTIARVDNREYVRDENQSRIRKLGITQMVYPELSAARELVGSMKTNWQRLTMTFGGGALELMAVKLRKEAAVLNQPFKSGFMNHEKFRVVAIKRGGKTFIPQGDDMMLEGDIAYIMLMPTEDNLEFSRDQCGKNSKRYKANVESVVIMGGGRMAVNTARLLIQRREEDKSALAANLEKLGIKTERGRKRVLIIEKDERRAAELKVLLPEVDVLCGDARDMDMMEREGLADADAFVALTDSSEANIIACLAAKQRFGVVKTIAEVENNDYIQLAQNLDIGTIVNKKLIAASNIYQMTLNGSVQNVTLVPLSSDAKVVEFEAAAGSRITKGKIKDMGIGKGVNFAGYVRDGIGYVCSGGTEIEAGDHVVVFCLKDSVHGVEELFN